jgi:hypothetical protein
MMRIPTGLPPWFRPRPAPRIIRFINGLPPTDAPAGPSPTACPLFSPAGGSENAAKRVRGRPFRKGVSGNPRGRPKGRKRPAANSTETAGTG